MLKKFLSDFRLANVQRADLNFQSIASWPPRHWQSCLAFEAGEVGNVLKKMQRIISGMSERDAGAQLSGLKLSLNAEIADCVTYLDLWRWSQGLGAVVLVEAEAQRYHDRIIHEQPIDAGFELLQSVMSGGGWTLPLLVAIYHAYGDHRSGFVDAVCSKFNVVSDRVGSTVKLDAREYREAQQA